MEARLIYQWLPKPRGGWRRGVKFSLTLRVRDLERQLLAPLPVMPIFSWPIGPKEWGWMSSKPKVSDRYGLPFVHYDGADWEHGPPGARIILDLAVPFVGTVYFRTQKDAVEFVGVLHRAKSRMVAAIDQWLADSPDIGAKLLALASASLRKEDDG